MVFPEISNVAFVSRSVSFRGVFVVIPLAFPERHMEQFNALEADFRTWGFVSTKPVLIYAVCGVFQVMGLLTSIQMQNLIEGCSFLLQNGRGRSHMMHLIHSTLSRRLFPVELTLPVITRTGMRWSSLASEHGEAGRSHFHQLSRLHSEYDQLRCERQYDNCLKNHGAYTIATLFYYAKQNGITI